MARTLEQAIELRAKQGGGGFTPSQLRTIVDATLKEVDATDESQLKFLGQGFFGDVFWLGDKRKVLKLTNDYTDAYASEIVRRKPDKNLVKVYQVFALADSYPAVIGIVNEKLSPLASHERAKLDYLRKLWNKAIGQRTFLTRQNLDKFVDSPQIEEVDDADYGLLSTLVRVFTDRHIKWRDLSGDNIMARGREKVVSDLGFSESLKQPIPVLVRL